MELHTCLRAVLNDSEVFRHYRILDKTLEWLDELRDNLRISRKTNLKDSTPGDIDLEEVTSNIKAVLAKICEEGREQGGGKIFLKLHPRSIMPLKAIGKSYLSLIPSLKVKKSRFDAIITG